MATIIHFIDVGQGNMALVQCADGNRFVVDCNITDSNQDRILGYIARQIGWGSRLTAFICTHRDADHIRGVQTLHSRFPINAIWDSGYPGTTTDSDEYLAYMRLRRLVGSRVIQKQTRDDYGRTRFRYLSAQDGRLPRNANAQGIVLKVEQREYYMSSIEGSTILPGDSDGATWKHGILRDYSATDLSSDIFLAAHHGSITFFEDPDDSRYYFTQHIRAIAPAMVVVSVGSNPYGHPDRKALALYEKYATGSNKGNKIFRTDHQGTMKLTLKDGGGWELSSHQ